MKKFILFFMLLCLFGCGVRVKAHYGFMGPDTYEATDGKVSVHYYNGNCCCVAKEVLESLANEANSGKLDWVLMEFPEFRERVLAEECKKVKDLK
jgi:hypothetical protein